jgi:hypothetical protein
MSTYDNGAIDTPEWAPDCRCGVCHTCVIPLRIPAGVELGEN